MELRSAIYKRRTVRAFSPEPIPQNLTDKLCDLARRSPSAGNTQATSFLILDTVEATSKYWESTLAPEKTNTFRWKQLLQAPVLILITTMPSAYVDHYGEHDKNQARLSESTGFQPVPFLVGRCRNCNPKPFTSNR